MKKFFVLMNLLFPALASASAAEGPIPGLSSGLSETQKLRLDEGHMIYEDSGTSGPTVVLIPGMGETRGTYRLLGPKLVALGFRVISVDPRGQGDSDGGFAHYSASAVGEDIIVLLDHLATDAYLVGNSSGGASAAWVAAKRPERVKGVVLLNAFLRDHPMSWFLKILMKVSLAGPWAPSAWTSYYESLFITNKPVDQILYEKSLKESLNKEGHVDALKAMAFASKSDVEKRLPDVRAPVLAMMGGKDPDFEKPLDELKWIESVMRSESSVIPDAGHYPQLEFPDQVADVINKFIKKL